MKAKFEFDERSLLPVEKAKAMCSVPPQLEAITDVVLNYRPKPKSKAAKKRAREKKRDAKKG